jgi:hypothetical protein
MTRSVRLGVDFVLRQRSKSYVNDKLFIEYINSIFVQYLNEQRESEEFEACEAVLLMDNCSLYMSDDIVTVLTRVRMRIITFASHTTHIFQMLDVVLFGALKKHPTGLEMLDDEQSTSAFLLKVYHDFKQTIAEVNIWKSFADIFSLITSSKRRMDYSSIRKSCDKIAASWSSGSATHPSRVC